MSAVVVALREIARRGNLSYTERHPAVVDAVELGGVISAADQAKVFQGYFSRADRCAMVLMSG